MVATRLVAAICLILGDTVVSDRTWTLGLRDELLSCERKLEHRCSGTNSFFELDGACMQNSHIPPPAITFFPDTNAAELGQIGRTLRFGRILWCLARSVSVSVVLEFFTGTGGGSTVLLAHGLAQTNGSLFSFERDQMNAYHAVHVLRSWGLPAEYQTAPAAARVFDRGEVPRDTTWIVHGELLDETGPESTALVTLCRIAGPVDFVFIDATSDLRAEWPAVERFCKPRMVAIHNTNVRHDHPGEWLCEYLLQTLGWHEVLNGSHPSAWEDGGYREWSLFAGGEPPHSKSRSWH